MDTLTKGKILTSAKMKGWDPYPGVLDIGIRYKVTAFIRAHLPQMKMKKHKQAVGQSSILFSHKDKIVRPLDRNDIPLIAQIRNARRYLPSFLEHYRKIGVTRFIFVDDQSTDGSTEYLGNIDDIDLYQSPLNYMESKRGILFKEAAVQIYGANRWWVFVDIDEYLVYHGIEEHGLSALTRALEKRRLTRLLAPLLDMYPIGDPKHARFDGSDSTMPWEVASAFDRSGYFLRFRGKDWEIRGGARHRIFQSWLELTKYPLMYVSEGDQFRSIHYPRPYQKNYTPVLGNLLHFKLFDDYEDSIRKSVQEGRHFGNAKHYKAALEKIEHLHADFYAPGISQEFTGAEQLLKLGFFKSIFRP